MRITAHILIALLLTLLTQLGGLAWVLAQLTRWRWKMFLPLYLVIWLGVQAAAPFFGRQPIPCTGAPLRMQSPLYCIAMRNFVTPDLAALAQDTAGKMAAAYPGTITLALDGGFPFLNGMPLIPHLSHDDGRKLDLAYFYTGPEGEYLPGATRSPVGYFAFETSGTGTCPPAAGGLRWDLRWLQPLFLDHRLDRNRTALLAQTLLDDPRLGRMFLEPPLARQLGVSGQKLGFQGCRAARHDDHIHIQL